MGSDQREMMQLIAAHQSRLRGFLRCMLVRSNDVDDLLQEVNLVLWEKADQFETGTDFWAWSSQIARFKVLNRIRAYSRDRLVFDESFVSELAEVASERTELFEERQEALEQCLRALPPAQRRMIDLRYIESKSAIAIAEQLQRPVGSVRQTLYRIRQSLLACIESKLPTEPQPSASGGPS
ncbi:sigma-70 family RNA polymerase sigma factor [Rhodopirellula sp. JC740]|uniref:Sigma-70 family RNA polymerase sigma factor n=1 Tax=Rhodopirellula halodulae TaxID=2894198 RepID=A0ABS8NIF1_9BACT|nr:sigma-70 family RNA polymerase sigma factor [Rhodopirellula sp. JC740]MCC9642568.1 sigma-70 family RNA polymerase sigma factor [Rhodopirellula sp. JC740]